MARGTHYSASESITVSTSSVGLTTATITGLNEAHITVETAAVRYWLDGSDPTAAVGHALAIGGILDLDSSESMENIRFIRRDGSDAVLRCSYGN